MRRWVGWRLRGQCEQHWGKLCGSFGEGCPLNQSDALQNATLVPPSAPGPLQQPIAAAQPDQGLARATDNGTEPAFQVSEKVNVSVS